MDTALTRVRWNFSAGFSSTSLVLSGVEYLLIEVIIALEFSFLGSLCILGMDPLWDVRLAH